MGAYGYLLALALILLFTKIFGLATAHVHLPQVVGALIAGILLGPSGIGILHETDFLVKTAEIGVIMLMFIAGIDTDINELKHTGPAACLIAAIGVFVPIIGCGGVYFLFFEDSFTYANIIKASFVGIVFAATSVSITVETLNEMGKLKTRVGATLLSAAIIDDIIGIVVLSVLSALGDSSVNPGIVVLKILGFFVFAGIVGFIVYKLFKKISINHGTSRRVAVCNGVLLYYGILCRAVFRRCGYYRRLFCRRYSLQRYKNAAVCGKKGHGGFLPCVFTRIFC